MNYAPNSYIIFDGYPETYDKSTKKAERRRQARKICPEIELQSITSCTVSQDKFFSNEMNKNRFIMHLQRKLQASGFNTNQAYENAKYSLYKQL